MPLKPLHPCAHPGCDQLIRGSKHCGPHHSQHVRDDIATRGTRQERGYGQRWLEESKLYLRRHPLCVCAQCRASGHPLEARVVDHIVPHRGDMKLFWDVSNWQPMAKACHDRKTVTEDGGFGNLRTGRAGGV